MDEITKLAMAGGKAGLSAINPVSAIAGGVAELGKLGLGIGQRIQANQLGKRTQRPVYRIPGAATNALYDQYNLAKGQMPGYSQAQDLLAQNNAGAMAAVAGSGGGQAEKMAALTGLSNNANTNSLQLSGDVGRYKAAQMANLINEENQYAQWQDAMRVYNEDEPYRNAMSKMSDLRDAGNTNIYDAIKSGGGLLAGTIGYQGDKTETAPVPNSVEQKYAGQPEMKIGKDGKMIPVVDNSKDYQNLLGIGDPLQPREGDVATLPPGRPTMTPILTPGADENVQRTQVTPLTSKGLGMPDISERSQRLAPALPKTPVSGLLSAPLLGAIGDSVAKVVSRPSTQTPTAGSDPVDRAIADGQQTYDAYNSMSVQSPLTKGMGPQNESRPSLRGVTKPSFNPMQGSDQGYDFAKMQELSAKEKDGSITQAERMALSKARKEVKKYSYLLK